MGDAPEHLDAARPVPGWPRGWLILFRLRDYLLGDALVLAGFWLRDLGAFWQYGIKVEESRRADEAVSKGIACRISRPARAPRAGGRLAYRVKGA